MCCFLVVRWSSLLFVVVLLIVVVVCCSNCVWLLLERVLSRCFLMRVVCYCCYVLLCVVCVVCRRCSCLLFIRHRLTFTFFGCCVACFVVVRC